VHDDAGASGARDRGRVVGDEAVPDVVGERGIPASVTARPFVRSPVPFGIWAIEPPIFARSVAVARTKRGLAPIATTAI
jgi:hypothetical protein